MAIINISRQPHCSRNEIALEVADNLGYRVVDKSTINSKVKDFYCNFSDELHDLANEKKPGFFKNFFTNQQLYNHLVQSIIFEEASNDNVVFNGRGGQYILDQPYALNIRVIAPFGVRCSYLEKEEDLIHSAAEKRLEKKDHDRENFIRYLFNKDVSEASAYDLIFNHHKLGTEDIISTIFDYAAKIENAHPLTDDHKDALKRWALEKRVEATLKKVMPEYDHLEIIGCEKLGDILIDGFYIHEINKDKIYKLVQSCRGVNSVSMQLTKITHRVGALSVD